MDLGTFGRSVPVGLVSRFTSEKEEKEGKKTARLVKLISGNHEAKRGCGSFFSFPLCSLRYLNVRVRERVVVSTPATARQKG